jgi:hypothetical protein
LPKDCSNCIVLIGSLTSLSDMSSTRSLVLSALSATIIAIVLVSGVVAIGVLNTTRSSRVTTFASVSTPMTQSNSSPQTVGTTESSSSPSGTTQTGPSGVLAVLMTDPPTVPNGVTDVYITYADLAIHVSGAGNNTGWHTLNMQGQIDLMSVINSTQTIADANITSGNFNALTFNVTSAVVTFQGSNYTSDLVYQNHMLYVPIVGGINVTAGQTSAALIDVSPTVLLLGTPANPTFAFIPTATAYTIPGQSVSTLHLVVGNRDNIQNAPWWVKIRAGSKFQVTGVSLTPTSLSFNVTNTGNAPVLLRIADIASRTSVSGGVVSVSNFGSLLNVSEVYVLEHNSSIVPIISVGNGAVENLVDSSGYILRPGQSQTFTYSGTISLGVAITSIFKNAQTQPIVPGQTYILSLTGNGLVAETYVIAG